MDSDKAGEKGRDRDNLQQWMQSGVGWPQAVGAQLQTHLPCCIASSQGHIPWLDSADLLKAPFRMHSARTQPQLGPTTIQHQKGIRRFLQKVSKKA